MKVAFRLRGLIVALSLLFVFACDDSDDANYGIDLRFQISSTGTGPYIPINFAIYETMEDYANNSNALISGKTEASKGTYFIREDQLKKNTEYYIDWYSDDFGHNNWSSGLERITFTYSGGGLQTFGGSSIAETPDKARKTFLNGNDPETNWRAVGASWGDDDVWNTIPPYEKYVRIKLRKDGTGVLTVKNDAEEEQTSAFTFKPSQQIAMGPDDQYLGFLDQTEDTNTILYASHRYIYTLVRE
jgi:hypothetical protein